MDGKEIGDGRLPGREWTTAGLPPGEQFVAWQEAVAQAFVPVTLDRPGVGAFSSGVTVRRLGPLEVADIVSSAQSVHRTVAQVERDPGDAWFINLPLVDGASVGQDGRVARLSSGDLAVVDGTRPFDLQFTHDFHQVSLKIPQELLRSRLGRPEEATAVTVQGHRGVGAVATAAIRSSLHAAASLDRRTATSLGVQLVDLVALALGGVRPQPAATSAALLLEAALDEVDRCLGDACLAPATVAARVGISVRYLHRLFEEHGTTFGRWLLGRRLSRAQQALTAGDQVPTISRIASDCGFADPSYFARAFKLHYGITPRQMRAQAVSASAVHARPGTVHRRPGQAR